MCNSASCNAAAVIYPALHPKTINVGLQTLPTDVGVSRMGCFVCVLVWGDSYIKLFRILARIQYRCCIATLNITSAI